MIEQVLNREFVLEQLRDVRRHLEAEVEEGRRGGGERPVEDAELTEEDYRNALEELRTVEDREEAESSGQPAFEPPEEERRGDGPATLDDYSYFSRDPVVGNLQSALEQYFEEREPDAIAEIEPEDDGRRGAGPAEVAVTDRRLRGRGASREPDGRRLFEQFSVTDVGWVSTLLAQGITKLRGKHPFVDPPEGTFEIPERCRIVMVGDWGSGIPRARKVGKQMRRAIESAREDGVEPYVIHLGDVYYSGWKREYKKRFLAYWPVELAEAEEIPSWSTNANHDMYSGGHAYFGTLLADPRFAQHHGSSCFALGNRHWQLLGIDTGWQDADLADPQPQWVEERAAKAAEAGTRIMLLSHHQPWSVEEKENGEETDKTLDVARRIAVPLEKGQIDAWFWGHEHRCQVFSERDGVRWGRLLGHGGVPVWQWRSADDPLRPTVVYEHRARFRSGIEWWARFGFAILDFDGPRIDVQYVDELGNVGFRETIG